ncbi:Uncharacterized protein APZ42_012317 [Daphnia magna]|uniref:Uncharacterized protein n=1 Tax=Daphnia magna TaxID=35525 RepID=A0A162RXQ2_9CRUS|nr:Uncharacterized protein APZ42_012317 [Daphnia magna]
MGSADEDDSGEAAVLLIESSCLITEELVCRGIRIKAVIDTGAVMSVASPSLQEKLGARRALELEIEHRGMEASGKVILLEMRGIESLLGNDFLSQFKRLPINYVPNGAKLLLGELPVNVIEELEAVKAPRLVTKTARMLPPRAIVPVEIEATTLNEATWMIEPSEHLARAKGLTADKVLGSSDQPLGQVLMVNLTNRRAYLREGAVLGQMEAVEPSIVEVDEGETPDSLGDDVGEDSAESIRDSDSTPRVTSIPRQAFRAQVASTLPPADVEKMVELLEEFDTSFALKEGELGSSSLLALQECALFPWNDTRWNPLHGRHFSTTVQAFLEAGYHEDQINEQGETALECIKFLEMHAVYPDVEFQSLLNGFLQAIRPLSCFCARVINKHRLPIDNLPSSLQIFVKYH